MSLNHGFNIKSEKSESRAFVIFENVTKRTIDVYWVNFTSQLVLYKTLKPLDRFMINTFQTHPWIFMDKFTGERMVVENEEVYWPKPWYLKIDPRQRMIRRTLVRIQFPLRSLKKNAMWSVVRHLQNGECIQDLQIPVSLRRELETLFKRHKRYCQYRNTEASDDATDESENSSNSNTSTNSNEENSVEEERRV
ncbi:protein Vhl [Culicoides brevitarsis]|uniref:protein Vhl n=1 Tax=Culicoides brevitarsis TaxID=469753 RepID=UPI00307C9EC2